MDSLITHPPRPVFGGGEGGAGWQSVICTKVENILALHRGADELGGGEHMHGAWFSVGRPY